MLSIRSLRGCPAVLTLVVLCATPAWSISPTTYHIEAKFIPGTLDLQSGEEARVEKWSAQFKQPFGKPECVLQMFVQATADSRIVGARKDRQHALALARGEVLKRVLEKSGLQGAAFLRTGVSGATSDAELDTAVFVIRLAPSIRYAATNSGFEVIPELAECSRR